MTSVMNAQAQSYLHRDWTNKKREPLLFGDTMAVIMEQSNTFSRCLLADFARHIQKTHLDLNLVYIAGK